MSDYHVTRATIEKALSTISNAKVVDDEIIPTKNVQCSSLKRLQIAINQTLQWTLLKQASENSDIATLQKTSDLFHNEIHMYEFLQRNRDYDAVMNDLFPKYFGGDLEHMFLVVEDLTEKGYQPSTFKSYLPHNQIEAAMTALGQYHGAMYVEKELHRLKFDNLIRNIRETRFVKSSGRFYFDVISLTSQLGLERLRQREVEMDLRGLNESFKDSLKLFQKLIEPKEPLAVICHGDFNQNNLLFSKNSVKIIDLQTPRYSSPALDLSFFLYMHVPADKLSENFDHFFNFYYSSVKNYLESHLDHSFLEVYSREKFLLDYKDHALYGYLISSMFFVVNQAENPVVFLRKTLQETLDVFQREMNGDCLEHIAGCLRHVMD